MAIRTINRSFYIQAMLGVVWASAFSPLQASEFKNGSDFLRSIPNSVGSLPESDPNLSPQTKEAIATQFPQGGIVPSKNTISQNAEEDAILAEAERMLHNELLNKPAAAILSDKKVAAAGDELIRLSLVKGRLHIEPSVLSLSLEGSEASVTIEGLSNVPQVFLRDSKKVSWDGKRFHGLAQGSTEIFFVYANEMYILPVQIGEAPAKSLVADLGSNYLSGLKMPEGLAQMPGDASGPRNSADLSIADASMQVHKTQAEAEAQQKRFVYNNASSLAYRDTAIQVMDVRSDPREGKIFPMAGVTVQLMGLGIQAKTDATGLARFADLPAGSRIWTVIADQEGRIVPTANEIVIPSSGKAQVQRVRTLSYQTYVNYMSVWGADQNWSNGSVCARALDPTGNISQEGLTVQINDENANGPFYFSEHGPQPGQKETGADGRFCFFNVKPGLAELSFFRNTNYQTGLTLPVFPGAHSEEDLPLTTGRAGNLYLASFGSAMDQLTGDDKTANTLESVVTANVISLGDNEKLPNTSENVLSSLAKRSEFKGRTYTLVQTAEFENTLQAQDRPTSSGGKQMPVLPLLPRGFVEDVFTELNQDGDRASIAFDPAMGQLVVMHKLAPKEDSSKLNIVVQDAYGRTIDQGWYFGSSSQGLVKAVFFNLQPGMYSVKVQTQSGALSAVDSVAVDFWTTAVLQTGGALQYDMSAPEVASQE